MSSRLSAFVVLVLASSAPCRNAFAGSTSDFAAVFNSEYQGHVLILRKFYQGSPVVYDLSGNLLKRGDPGAWTSEGVVLVKSVQPVPDGLRFNCHRVEIAFDRKQTHLYESGDVEIDIESREQTLSVDKLNDAMTKIFLNPGEGLRKVIPAYWRPFFSSHKRLYRRLQAQLAQSGEFPSRIEKESANLAALSHAEPQIESESQVAGRAVTASFSIIVDKTGRVTEVAIKKPVGLGLDDRAVKVIREWKFKPAEPNGVPVPTLVVAKIRFKLTGGASPGN
jgi:TonB family protein